MPLVVLLSGFTGSNVRTRNLIRKVQAKTVKIWRGTKLNTCKWNLLWQVILVEQTEWWPFELVLVDWTERLHLLECRHPEIMTWTIDYSSSVGWNWRSNHRLSTILECLTPVTKRLSITTNRLWLLETLLYLLVQGIRWCCWLGQSDNSLMRGLKEILHDGVVLLQECFHLLNQVLWLLLCPLIFVSQTIYFLVKLMLNRFKLDMKAFFVQFNIGF